MSSYGSEPPEKFTTPICEPVPSLRAIVDADGFDLTKLSVGLPAAFQQKRAVLPRNTVHLTDGVKAAPWEVPALRELFRGNRTPPNLERYPPEYVPYFHFIEQHVNTLFHAAGDRTDQQMEELYSLLRRRPEGRSIGAEHDFLWQSAALMLGLYPLSGAEYEAIFGRLESSVRAMAMRPVSRNYAGTIHRHCH